MDPNKIISQITEQIKSVLNNNYTQDLENNIKAILTGIFNKLHLVTREEFEVQQQVLIDTRKKLAELEAQLNNLQNKGK